MPAVFVCDLSIHYDDFQYSKADKRIWFNSTTHIHGHILDLVISRAVDQSVIVKYTSIADHLCIGCVLTISRPFNANR